MLKSVPCQQNSPSSPYVYRLCYFSAIAFMGMHVCTCMSRSGIDVEGLPQLLFISLFSQGLSLNLTVLACLDRLAGELLSLPWAPGNRD